MRTGLMHGGVTAVNRLLRNGIMWKEQNRRKCMPSTVKQRKTIFPQKKTNAYALYHAQGIYEGQRGEQDNEKRVLILPEVHGPGSSVLEQSLWSGDIEASWETLRKQIAAGLHFSASGLPFWTVDIGAFFVKNGNFWFWKGHYDAGTEDLGYRELFVRWYQWACFLPVFRGHGTDCRRELWHFENTEIPFYDALVQMNHLRYTLMPYIYSCAGLCWLKDRSMMKLLAFAYPEETAVFILWISICSEKN